LVWAGLLVLFLAGAGEGHAAARKSVKKAVTPKPVARETVYVAMPPKPEPAPEPAIAMGAKPRASDGGSNEKRESRAKDRHLGPIPLERQGQFAYGLSLGIYEAEVLGANPFAQGMAEWFPLAGPLYFQFTAGIGTVQSSFSEEIVGADVFEKNWMLAFEALGGYAIDLSGKAGTDISRGLRPILLAGMTAVWQGGVPNFGGVVGFGHRFPVPFMTRNASWAIPFMIKDHIYSQKIRTTPSLTQNLVLTLGVQKYF